MPIKTDKLERLYRTLRRLAWGHPWRIRLKLLDMDQAQIKKISYP